MRMTDAERDQFPTGRFDLRSTFARPRRSEAKGSGSCLMGGTADLGLNVRLSLSLHGNVRAGGHGGAWTRRRCVAPGHTWTGRPGPNAPDHLGYPK